MYQAVAVFNLSLGFESLTTTTVETFVSAFFNDTSLNKLFPLVLNKLAMSGVGCANKKIIAYLKILGQLVKFGTNLVDKSLRAFSCRLGGLLNFQTMLIRAREKEN